MAVTITLEEVKAFGVTAPDVLIEAWIDLLTDADACLDARNVSDNTQRLLKLYAIGHMGTLNAGGQIRSQSAPSGASRSFAVPTGQGINSTTHGATLKSLDRYGCIVGMLEADVPKPFIASIGPGRRRGCA